jgi:hypothetical protein
MRGPVIRTALLAVLCLLPALAWGIGTTTVTLQSAAAGNVNGTPATVSAYTAATIQVVLTGAATISFQGSVDATNYTALECFSIADRTASVTSTTGNGAWRCNVIGLNRIRAPITNCAGCTVTVLAGLVSAGVN